MIGALEIVLLITPFFPLTTRISMSLGSIVAAACNYFEGATVSQAPAATFLWVHTFK